MERDYRFLGLGYNRLLEQQEEQAEQRSRLRDAGDEPPPPPPGPSGSGAGGAPHTVTEPSSWNYTHVSEDMGMREESPLQLANTSQVLMPVLQVPEFQVHYRKRKSSSFGSASVYDGSSEDSQYIRTLPEFKKQSHSEIEKRRRDKMNTYISQLSCMVPTCGTMSKKLDKITVLKMVVQYLRGIKGVSATNPWPTMPPSEYLSERELTELVRETAQDAFLIVVGCDGGRLIYVSASIKKMLHYDQSELLGQSVFDFLHSNDIAMFKSQLSSSGATHRETFIDKEALQGGGSRFCSGARRSFFCRIKYKAPIGQDEGDHTSMTVKRDSDSAATYDCSSNSDKKYCVVQCTGYLKSWPSAEMDSAGEGGVEETETGNLSCLVAVGRMLTDLVQQPPVLMGHPTTLAERSSKLVEQPPPAPPTRLMQYMSRHAIDGKFLFVDPRVTVALGYLPHELVGTGLYQYVSETDMEVLARTYRAALQRREKLLTPTYSFRKKDGSLVRLQTHFKPFNNPWTKEEEHLAANNTVVHESGGSSRARDSFQQEAPRNRTQLAVHELQTSDVVVEGAALGGGHGAPPPDHAALLLLASSDPVQGSLYDVEQGLAVVPSLSQVHTDVLMGVPAPSPATSAGGEGASTSELDGNDEAAMSIIMSLLEADAGLGGPVNLSGLPWPLP